MSLNVFELMGFKFSNNALIFANISCKIIRVYPQDYDHFEHCFICSDVRKYMLSCVNSFSEGIVLSEALR